MDPLTFAREPLAMPCLLVAEGMGSFKVKCCEDVVYGLSSPDLQHRVIGPVQVFGRPEFAIVVEAHRVSMRATIVDRHNIPWAGHWLQCPVYCKLIIVLA